MSGREGSVLVVSSTRGAEAADGPALAARAGVDAALAALRTIAVDGAWGPLADGLGVGGEACSVCHHAPAAIVGNSSQVRPSRSRPSSLQTPPHCLKKNGTRADWH